MTLAFDQFRSPARRPGFTFIEVLFAVIILGVGLIMIAAMLPVAIKQGQDTRNDIQGKVLTESAFAMLKSVATDASIPQLNTTSGTTDYWIQYLDANAVAATNVIAGDAVFGPDPRYAWMGLFRRDDGSPTAKVFLFGIQRSVPEGDPFNADPNGTATPPASYSQLLFNSDMVYIDETNVAEAEIIDSDSPNFNSPTNFPLLVRGVLGPDFIRIRTPPASQFDRLRNILVEGSTILIAKDDQLDNIGRRFILGPRREDLEVVDPTGVRIYELLPGSDLTSTVGADGKINTTDDVADVSLERNGGQVPVIAVVGRQLLHPGDAWDAADNPYVGPAQTIGYLEFDLDLSN
jgi:prepilin-type N-terminal cleavage/methylation domain-containing protein